MTNMAYMCKNRHGMYYARFIIPKPLQPHFKNKKEIRRSLQTDSRKLAIKRARIYRVEFESIVEKLMSKADNTSERAKQIINSLFAEKPKATELIPTNKPDKPTNIDSDKTQLITYVDLSGITVTIDTGNDEQDAKTFKQIAPTPSDEQLARQEKRAEELHQAQLAAITIAPALSAPAHAIPIGETVSKCFDDYIAHKLTPGKKGSWSAGTARQKPNKLKVFRSVFGERPISVLTRIDMDDYIKIAYLIPSNFDRPNYKKFKDISVDMVMNNAPEIAALDYEVRGAGTVREDLKIIRVYSIIISY